MTTLPVPVGQDSVGSWAGKLYVAGGFVGGTSITSTLQIYDIASNTWTFGPSMPASVEAAAGATLNGKFYVIGGDDYSTSSQRTTFIFDIATNTWSQGALLPDPIGRTNTNGVGANGRVYVFGGASFDGQSSTPVDTMESYDPATNTWTTLASANTGGLGNYAGIAPFTPGTLLVTDGGDGQFTPSSGTHIYKSRPTATSPARRCSVRAWARRRARCPTAG